MKKVLFITGGTAAVILLVLLVLLVRFIMLSIGYNSGTFIIREDEVHGNGRTLRLNMSDDFYAGNIFPPPVYAHRPTGQVDTLHVGGYEEVIPEYVQRVHYGKKWLVLETKNVSLILGRDYLAREEYKSSPIDSLLLGCYTYRGQRVLFDSDAPHYWMANRQTTDIYGPLTESELRTRLKRLRIPLPLILEGEYDRYVYNFTEELEGNRFRGERLPKEFHYWHWRERPDRTIQP